MEHLEHFLRDTKCRESAITAFGEIEPWSQSGSRVPKFLYRDVTLAERNFLRIRNTQEHGDFLGRLTTACIEIIYDKDTFVICMEWLKAYFSITDPEKMHRCGEI